MKIVFLNQYYPPDVAPTGVMLEAVVEECVRKGHEVTVICSAGGYGAASGSAESQVISDQKRAGEKAEGMNPGLQVVRVGATRFGRGSFLGKVVDYLSYYVKSAWVLWRLGSGVDRVVALTTPPYLSVLARVMSKLRRADHAHWVMDLYPDVMSAHGMLRESSVGYRVLRWLARWGFGGKRCAAVLTLGPDMAERVGRLLGAGDGRVQWVPLWGGSGDAEGDSGAGEGGEGTEVGEEGRLEACLPRQAGSLSYRAMRGWGKDEVVVMYSGNMGLGHRFGETLEVAGEGVSGFRFVFFGGGMRRGEIEGFLNGYPGSAVELHDYAPADLLAAHLRSADVHLASLDEAWTGTMVPSKLQGIFEVGRPVVFVGGRDSSIGRWVVESGGGWVVGAGDVGGLRSALVEAADPVERQRRGRAAREFARVHFNRERNVRRVVEILVRGVE